MKYFFFQNSAVYCVFFIFFIILTFYFQFTLSVLVNKFYKFLCFLILWIRDFMKEFWKIMEYFSEKCRHLNPKFLINSIVLFFFIFSAFWYSFFPISPIQTCQKIRNIFVVLYCTDYRIYLRILENCWICIKKIELL